MERSSEEKLAFRNYWENETEFNNFIKLFRDVYLFLERNESAPCTCFGTLLGAVRNGRQIPWDGDADLFVDKNRFFEIKEKFELFLKSQGYEIIADGSHNFKIYRKDSVASGPFKWPWIDIDFIGEDEENVTFYINIGAPFSRHLRGDVFPFKKITYEGMTVNCPNNPKALLDSWYPNWENFYQSAKVNHQTTKWYGKRYNKSIRSLQLPTSIANHDYRPIEEEDSQ